MIKNHVMIPLGVALGALPHNFRVGLISTPVGDLFCNVTTGIVSSPDALLELSIVSYSFISGIASDDDIPRLTFTSSDNGSEYSVTLNSTLAVRDTASGRSTLAVGRYSGFMHQVGSVAILKNDDGAQMLLGSSLESFNAFCIPDSLMEIPFPTSRTQVWFDLGDGVTIEAFGYRDLIIMKSRGLVASVPTGLMRRLDALISENPNVIPIVTLLMDPNHAGSLFGNCTREDVARLPPIKISPESGGYFTLIPDDYVLVSESRRECWVRLMASEAPNNSWVDLFLLDGTNVRADRDGGWHICDSSGF